MLVKENLMLALVGLKLELKRPPIRFLPCVKVARPCNC